MFDFEVKKDEYGEVINSEETYSAIAKILRDEGRCVFGWTDEHATHFDILMTIKTPQAGNLQRGCKGSTDLFVAIVGLGAFGFEMNAQLKHPGYVQEKLRFSGDMTAEKLADLINSVIHFLEA